MGAKVSNVWKNGLNFSKHWKSQLSLPSFPAKQLATETPNVIGSIMKQLLLTVIVAILAGCSAVYTPVPIGDQPVNIEDSRDAWNGTWVCDGEPLTVVVTDGSNGVLRIGWIEENHGELRLETALVNLRSTGDWTFANYRSESDTNETRYVWGRIEKKEREVIVWAPDVEKFAALVQNGILPGSTGEYEVVLGELSSNHLAVITSETNGVLFNWKEPMVFIKSGQ